MPSNLDVSIQLSGAVLKVTNASSLTWYDMFKSAAFTIMRKVALHRQKD